MFNCKIFKNKKKITCTQLYPCHICWIIHPRNGNNVENDAEKKTGGVEDYHDGQRFTCHALDFIK